MNKKNGILLILCLVLKIHIIEANDIYDYFGSSYDKAIKKAEKLMQVIKKYDHNINNDSCILISTVFPELLRSSVIRNKIEEASLRYLYVNYGVAVCDFSTGILQMKPSFIEGIDKILGDETFRNKHNDLKIDSENVYKKRQIIFDRLLDVEYQIRYLLVIIDYADKKFNIYSREPLDRLKYYTMIFNMGLDATESDLEKFLNIKQFPYGKDFNNPFIYYEVSKAFYRTYKE